MSRQARVYKLSDGSNLTAEELADKVGCTLSTARCRLARTADVGKLFKAPVLRGKARKGVYKIYTLEDGSEWTAPEVAEHVGCSLESARHRLCTDTTVERVFRDIGVSVPRERKQETLYKDRMYCDTLGHWKLINAFT